MKLAIREIIQLKEYYETYYETVHQWLRKDGTITIKGIDDHHFQEELVKPLSIKLYTTENETMNYYIHSMYEVVHRLSSYIEAFQYEVDSCENALLDASYYEALYTLYDNAFQYHQKEYEQLQELEELCVEGSLLNPLTWSELTVLMQLLDSNVRFFDDLLQRFFQFEQRHATFFDDLLNQSFFEYFNFSKQAHLDTVVTAEGDDATTLIATEMNGMFEEKNKEVHEIDVV